MSICDCGCGRQCNPAVRFANQHHADSYYKKHPEEYQAIIESVRKKVEDVSSKRADNETDT